MKRWLWGIWGLITLGLGGYYGHTLLLAEDKSALLIGQATHGHYQIELACSSCHTSAFGGGEVLQNACVDCHGDELKAAHDSHPRKKFTDPRNADLLQIIDARQCVSCHNEHQREQTHAMGVTLPDDYCYHCHKEVVQDRASHKDLPFDSCASAGCHNYHDNRALYEDFLVANAKGDWLKALNQLAEPNRSARNAQKHWPPLSNQANAQASAEQQANAQITADWALSAHAQAQISCAGCHNDGQGQWLAKPALAQCQSCHQDESAEFLQSKHGMRLAAGLTPMTPAHSNALAFHEQAQHSEQSCNSCHQPHRQDTRHAAASACLTCHNDEHSANYWASPHGQITQQALDGQRPWSEAVTCATCHLPRVVTNKPGVTSNAAELAAANAAGNNTAQVAVLHNQNLTLRPNEKMLRPVCMSCHSLPFAIDALADEALLNNNFSGPPVVHVPSVDWAVERAK
ncbi:cytochrome c3 family protein [Atopomonas hussainii]|uniref:cytochrome c3 family protein n=1 Tax=Atopomonas hussainii TaxID=1429083 RepID=UPI000900293A|nr:cytochrome c3 family protein [Atopomonas hussainii]